MSCYNVSTSFSVKNNDSRYLIIFWWNLPQELYLSLQTITHNPCECFLLTSRCDVTMGVLFLLMGNPVIVKESCSKLASEKNEKHSVLSLTVYVQILFSNPSKGRVRVSQVTKLSFVFNDLRLIRDRSLGRISMRSSRTADIHYIAHYATLNKQ